MWTVTISVRDGLSFVPGAAVELQGDEVIYSGTTNLLGQAVLAVEESVQRYTVSITATGFLSFRSLVAISGNTTETYQLIAVATGHITAYDGLGETQSDVPFYAVLVDGPGVPGVSYSPKIRAVYSDSNGLAEFTRMYCGATYQVRRDKTGREVTVKVPDTDQFELPEILGWT